MSAGLFVCVFVLYSRPHRSTDGGEIRREGGHRAGIGFSDISDPIRQPVCQIFAKNTRFLVRIHIVWRLQSG